LWKKQRENMRNVFPVAEGYMKKTRFLSNISLYLGNDTTYGPVAIENE